MQKNAHQPNWELVETRFILSSSSGCTFTFCVINKRADSTVLQLESNAHVPRFSGQMVCLEFYQWAEEQFC